jgi:hypothetical protein
MANPPPLTAPSAPSKRPWYLAFALLAAMSLGMVGGCSGMLVMATLHADVGDVSTQCEPEVASADGTTNADDADRVRSLCEAWLTSLSNARSRVFPISIATLLLGYGAVFFAARARRGRASARPLLVQLVAAQAVLGIVAYMLQPDTRRAETEFAIAKATAQQRARTPDSSEVREAIRIGQAGARLAAPLWLAFNELAYLLVILALTRPRSRAFFDSTPDPAAPQ